MATVVNGIDALTPLDDGRTFSQRRADGLVGLASHRCDTAAQAAAAVDEKTGEIVPIDMRPVGLRGGSRGVPTYSVIIDTRDVSMTAAGTIEVSAAGCLPTLTARAVEAWPLTPQSGSSSLTVDAH